jgi:rhamnosyltransferase
MTAPAVTVAVLTYNGEQYLDALLTAVEAQQYAGEVELLVIDSGSTDTTLEIVGRHPRVRLHEIPNSEFGHGRTRDLAARLATGEFVAYLTHDAVPASEHWLSGLVEPLVDDERIAAVVGKQVPRPDAPPVLKYDIQRVFERLGPDYGYTVVYDDGTLRDEGARNAAAFYSDANSAARRSVLTGAVPYRDVPYAEDQQFGRDVLDAGLRKAYAPRGAVLHSNDVTFGTLAERIAADQNGLRSIGRELPRVSRTAALAQALRWAYLDAPRIAVDREYPAARRLWWLLANPWWQLRKWNAYRRASNG